MSPRLVRLAKAVVLLCSLAVFFGAGAWVSLRLAVRRSPVIRVPDLVGMPSTSAEEALRAAGLVPEISGRRYDPKQAEGRVLAQVPAARSSTRPGRPVRLVVSLGTRRTSVPDLTGSSDGRAQVTLRGSGLGTGEVVRVPDPSMGQGRVVGQHPAAGSDAGPGDKVDLVMSSGPPPRAYVMPDLTGRPLAPTVAALARRGFSRARGQGGSGDARITAQQPKAGFPVTTSDEVVLTAGPG